MKYELTDSDVATLRQMLAWQRSSSADNGVNSPGAAASSQSGTRRVRRRALIQSGDAGEFQGDIKQMLTNNSPGYGPAMFVPPR